MKTWLRDKWPDLVGILIGLFLGLIVLAIVAVIRPDLFRPVDELLIALAALTLAAAVLRLLIIGVRRWGDRP